MRLPSPAMVVALIALIVAMSGSAYAVTQLPRNSVGAVQLKTSAVTSAKLANNAVTSAKIKNGTIQVVDLSPRARTELRGATGAQGEPGARGATGAQGDQGATGPPGPSIGGSTTATPGTVIPTGLTQLISLGTAPTARSSGPVTVDARSRLQISGSVNLKKGNGDAGNVGTVFCVPEWAAVDSGVWNLTAGFGMGTVSLAQAPEGEVWGTISVEDFVEVAAGTYDVRLVCRRTGVGIVADYAAINVVAIPVS